MPNTFVPKTKDAKQKARLFGARIQQHIFFTDRNCLEVAKAIGLSKSVFSRILTGETLPSSELRKKILSEINLEEDRVIEVIVHHLRLFTKKERCEVLEWLQNHT